MIREKSNPILIGFHPDPSALRVGKDYYVATSTFEWFPGVRIYHSKDLSTWDLISTPLDTVELLDMKGIEASCGIWAPCLSHDGDIFYLIYTVVHTAHGYPYKDTPNYITTAKSIDGPWSAPIYLNSSGFDPSLFHDKDGRKWLVNMQWDYRKAQGGKQFTGILLQEIKENRLVGEAVNIFRGTNRSFTEGPHLYWRNGYYYLLCAEGGTSYKHVVTLARSKSITGKYEVHPNNAVLTSWEGRVISESPYDEATFMEDMGKSYLKKAGHGSLVEASNGKWYLFHLCARPLPNTSSCVLGRETAMQEVEWKEDGWLYLKRGGNHPFETVEIEVPEDIELLENEGTHKTGKKHYTFDGESFRKDFQTLRIPYDSAYFSLHARVGYLRIVGRESIYSRYYQSLMARRQEDFCFYASTEFDFQPTSFQHMAGLIYRYDEKNQYYLFVSYDEEKKCKTLNAISVIGGEYRLMEQSEIEGMNFKLGLLVKEDKAQFYVQRDLRWQKFGKEFSTLNLSDDFTYGFTGAFVGICVQDLCNQTMYADFKSFSYDTKIHNELL